MNRIGLLVFLCLSSFPISSYASVIAFSTYGPNDLYDTTDPAYTIGMGWTQGNQFSPLFSGNLAEIDFAFGHSTGNNTVTAQLLTDNNGAPGVVLDTFNLTVTNVYSSQGSVVVGMSNLHPLLLAGTKYWVVATSDATSNNPWYVNAISAMGPRYENNVVTGVTIVQDTMATFRVVEVEALAPEPSAFLLTAFAMPAIWLIRRRRSGAPGSKRQ